ncbi:hypothetical protein PI124_g22765 [Phytophthora idaei]|nr:hypothetical protein PI124_g22765 [Phytophthora idaei]
MRDLGWLGLSDIWQVEEVIDYALKCEERAIARSAIRQPRYECNSFRRSDTWSRSEGRDGYGHENHRDQHGCESNTEHSKLHQGAWSERVEANEWSFDNSSDEDYFSDADGCRGAPADENDGCVSTKVMYARPDYYLRRCDQPGRTFVRDRQDTWHDEGVNRRRGEDLIGDPDDASFASVEGSGESMHFALRRSTDVLERLCGDSKGTVVRGTAGILQSECVDQETATLVKALLPKPSLRCEDVRTLPNYDGSVQAMVDGPSDCTSDGSCVPGEDEAWGNVVLLDSAESTSICKAGLQNPVNKMVASMVLTDRRIEAGPMEASAMVRTDWKLGAAMWLNRVFISVMKIMATVLTLLLPLSEASSKLRRGRACLATSPRLVFDPGEDADRRFKH